mgnify:CR=1 FL=1
MKNGKLKKLITLATVVASTFALVACGSSSSDDSKGSDSSAKKDSETVYRTLDEIKKDGKIQFSIKNISENPLNFQADELTERFIRGDVSRSTEGSGLGLSIAKNLTVLQHGTFNIYLDGDLFKVTITFDEAVKEKKPMSPMIVPEPVQEEAQQDV